MTNYIESGMDFSPLFDSKRFQSFHIENSTLYQRLKAEGVKTVEFVSIKGEEFYFIEAKSSFPDTTNLKSKEKIKENCQQLYNKLHHSLDLIIAQKMGIKKHEDDESIKTFSESFLNYKIIFLVVMGQSQKTGEWFEKEWCENVRVALEEKLKPLRSIWDINVVVIHNEKAREKGFIK